MNANDIDEFDFTDNDSGMLLKAAILTFVDIPDVKESYPNECEFLKRYTQGTGTRAEAISIMKRLRDHFSQTPE